jgi:hypothetical protein
MYAIVPMDDRALAAYLAVAPPDMPWSQICNLARVARAMSKPVPIATFEAIRVFLVSDEAHARRNQ